MPLATVPTATYRLQFNASFTFDAATAIVDYREKNGSFKSLDDLKKVTAVDAKEIESRKDRIAF